MPALPVITALMPLVGELIDRAFPDSAARELARLEVMAKMQESLNRLDLAQLDVNKQEAAHASLFVAGWRPFIGWTCGAGWLAAAVCTSCDALGTTVSGPLF